MYSMCVHDIYVCIVVHDISNNNINIIHSFPENIQVTYMSCTYIHIIYTCKYMLMYIHVYNLSTTYMFKKNIKNNK